MEPKVLVDELGTKYLASHWAGDVAKKFEKWGKGTVVDLDDARIVSDVMSVIMDANEAYDIVVIDSTNPERNFIFEENRRRAGLRKKIEAKNPVRFPVLKTGEPDKVVEEVWKLNKDLVYRIEANYSESQLAFIFLSQAKRPKIQIDLSSCADHLLTFIYRNLFPNPYDGWRKFYVVRGSTFLIRKPKVKEIPRFVRDNIVVPTDFGKKNLFKLPEWDRCLDIACEIIERDLRSESKHIIDYLPGVGESAST